MYRWLREPINAIDRPGRRKREKHGGWRDSRVNTEADSRGWATVSSSLLVFFLIYCEAVGFCGVRRPDSHRARGPQGSAAEDTLTESRGRLSPRRKFCCPPCYPAPLAHIIYECRECVRCTGNAAPFLFSLLVLNNNKVTGLRSLRTLGFTLLPKRLPWESVYVCDIIG